MQHSLKIIIFAFLICTVCPLLCLERSPKRLKSVTTEKAPIHKTFADLDAMHTFLTATKEIHDLDACITLIAEIKKYRSLAKELAERDLIKKSEQRVEHNQMIMAFYALYQQQKDRIVQEFDLLQMIHKNRVEDLPIDLRTSLAEPETPTFEELEQHFSIPQLKPCPSTFVRGRGISPQLLHK